MTATDAFGPAPATVEAGWLLPRPFRVVTRRQDTADTVTLGLRALDGAPLRFAPGAFTMVEMFGVGEVPISISGDPASPELLEHTIRDVGAVTHALVGSEPGTVVGVRGPYGRGWQVRDATGQDLLVVAGGIGLAPLRPALLDVLAHRGDYGRVILLYGARRAEDILFADELARWAARRDIEVQISVDYRTPGWQGRVGLVTALVAQAGFDAERTLTLVCGPEIMMRLVAAALLERGVPAPRVRLSLERNMHCGVGLCGHCQVRELFVCVDGPVLSYDRVDALLSVPEL
ncbi:MAG TPA: FAD/NAD(P)-binding protein [Kineosporiaceae bacterium]|nr:FAD/NAD(P)-binding protein [Kineosporiaceae bacterium]